MEKTVLNIFNNKIKLASSSYMNSVGPIVGLAFAATFQSGCTLTIQNRTAPDPKNDNFVLISIDGIIDDEALQPLWDELKEPRKNAISVSLNSKGGSLESSLSLVREMQNSDRYITTVVKPGAKCQSSCTILFAGGAQRIAHDDALFAFHKPKIITDLIPEALHAPFKEVSTRFMENIYASVSPDLVTFLGKNQILEKRKSTFIKAYELYKEAPGYITSLTSMAPQP